MAIGRRALARLEKKNAYSTKGTVLNLIYFQSFTQEWKKADKSGNFGSQFQMSKINLIFLKS